VSKVRSIVGDAIAATIFTVAVLGILGTCVKLGYDAGYRFGQIDAQTGKVRWHLVDQPDGSRAWEEPK